jgi:hypothetical protein
LENRSMRMLILFVAIVYIVGIGVVLSPTVQSKWSGASASDFTTSVVQALPNAATWPARVFHG